jgi:hypothetical protein
MELIMSNYDYLNDFLGDEDEEVRSSSVDVEIPEWASDKNASLAAFQTIEKLKWCKLQNISAVRSSKQFDRNKSNYLIGKAEVAKAIGVKPAPLFNSPTSSFSNHLKAYFDKVNDMLAKKVKFKLDQAKNGVRSRSKDDLVSEVQQLRGDVLKKNESTPEESFIRFLNKLPFDIRQKLGVDRFDRNTE